MIFKLLPLFCDQHNEAYTLLERVFHEQYKVADPKNSSKEQAVLLWPLKEIKVDGLQSLHDPEKDDLQLGPDSLIVTDTRTGERHRSFVQEN